MNIETLIKENTAALLANTAALLANTEALKNFSAGSPAAVTESKVDVVDEVAEAKAAAAAEDKAEKAAKAKAEKAAKAKAKAAKAAEAEEGDDEKITHADLRALAKKRFTEGELDERKAIKAKFQELLEENDATALTQLDDEATADVYNTLKSL